VPVQSTEEEESRRTKRESAASLYKARTTGGEREVDGTKKQGVREGRTKLEEAMERRERDKRDKENERKSERNKMRE